LFWKKTPRKVWVKLKENGMEEGRKFPPPLKSKPFFTFEELEIGLLEKNKIMWEVN